MPSIPILHQKNLSLNVGMFIFFKKIEKIYIQTYFYDPKLLLFYAIHPDIFMQLYYVEIFLQPCLILVCGNWSQGCGDQEVPHVQSTS